MLEPTPVVVGLVEVGLTNFMKLELMMSDAQRIEHCLSICTEAPPFDSISSSLYCYHQVGFIIVGVLAFALPFIIIVLQSLSIPRYAICIV